jgi:catechol 2,3-dioxygenase-like lactoylglutathione lyase family enzyme
MRLLLCFLLAVSNTLLVAQVFSPNESGVAMGHLHLNVRDVEAQKKFWTDVMGAGAAKLGSMDVIKLPGVVVVFRRAEPKSGTKGTVINHLGFKVPDVPKFIAAAKARGASVVTAQEVPNAKGGEFWFNPAVNTRQAFLMGPDDVKIEISEEQGMKEPIAHHHIHWYIGDVDATKAWYVKMFGGKPGKRGPFEAADVPGVNLSFSKSETPVQPTRGTSVDHIGFEIANLEAFCKKLESMGVKFDVPYRHVASINLAVAFLTDPWGTYIELTEGLNRL